MLANVEFDYNTRHKLNQLGREFYKEFQDRFAELKFDDWLEDKAECPYMYGGNTVIDLATDGVWLTQYEIPFTLKRFKGAYYTDSSLQYPQRKPEVSAPPTIHIQVAIPDLALLSIREVRVLEDACTDELQDRLDNGWRIIAVCPPNSQRRPDYILGKTS